MSCFEIKSKPATFKRDNIPLILLLTTAASVRVLYLLEASQFPNFAIPYAGLDADMYRHLAGRIAGGDLLLGARTRITFQPCMPISWADCKCCLAPADGSSG